MLTLINVTCKENKIGLGCIGRFRGYYATIKTSGQRSVRGEVKLKKVGQIANWTVSKDKNAETLLKAWAEKTIKEHINAEPIVLDQRQKDLIQDLRNGPMIRCTDRLARSAFHLTWKMIHYMVEKDLLKEDHDFIGDRVYYSLTHKSQTIEL